MGSMKNIFNVSLKGSDAVINVCKSAPNQIQPLPKIQEICHYWLSKDYKEILDIGCGYLRNSIYISQYFSVHVFDFPEITESNLFKNRLESLTGNHLSGIYNPKTLEDGNLRVDAAFLALVLHTLPEIETRYDLILNVKKNLKYPNEIFIAVPCGEKYYRKRAQTLYNDGFLLHFGNGQKSFYRSYTAKQIDGFMLELNFKLKRVIYTKKKILMRFYQSSE
jgi:hypothetical protein